MTSSRQESSDGFDYTKSQGRANAAEATLYTVRTFPIAQSAICCMDGSSDLPIRDLFVITRYQFAGSDRWLSPLGPLGVFEEKGSLELNLHPHRPLAFLQSQSFLPRSIVH